VEQQALPEMRRKQQQVATFINIQWKVGSTSTDTMPEPGRATIPGD